MAERFDFGEWGELTPKSIAQANLTKHEKARAYEMMKVQAVYLQILDCLDYPVDPEGHVHDLSALGSSKIAIAWTLALAGFQRTGNEYIKKRQFTAPGCYEDAYTWVDSRQPDTAEAALKPEDSAHDPNLPPDTRRLAAIRDGVPPMEPQQEWQTKVEVKVVNEPREAK